jgi:hypothetical protein
LICFPTTADVAFGTSLGCADVDGDGLVDAFGGAPGASQVLLWPGVETLGPADGCGAVPRFTISEPSDFGASVAYGGDTDRDGYQDLIIGAPAAKKAYLYKGQPNAAPARTADIGPNGDGFGASAHALFNVTPGGNDAYFAIGGNGHVQVYKGTNASPILSLDPPLGAGPGFGRAIE